MSTNFPFYLIISGTGITFCIHPVHDKTTAPEDKWVHEYRYFINSLFGGFAISVFVEGAFDIFLCGRTT